MHEGGHSFNWFSLIPALHGYQNHVVTTVAIVAILCLCAVVANIQLSSHVKNKNAGLIPEDKMTFRNFFEVIAEFLFKLTESVLGHHEAVIYFPVVGSLFLFIFVSNILGLIPGFLPPTDNLNTTLALGMFVFVYYNFVGFVANGVGYLKHFLGPILWLSPLMLVIEIASHVFRPLSLALRLRGNIMGDHVVLGIFSDLVPAVLPVIFYGLGVFVALVQALVFCLMTMVYISLSTSHDH